MKMAISGVADIDIYKSTSHKEGKPKKAITQVFSEYHKLVEKTFKEFGGEIWHIMGDGIICIFPAPSKAIDACIELLKNLYSFNNQNETYLTESPLFLRVGIHEIKSNEIINVPEKERGKFAHPALDIAGKLQKNCPIGKIAVSMDVYKNIPLKQRLFRPSLTEIGGEKFFVMIDRLIMPQEEKLLNGLDEKQKMAIPPIPFLSWNKIMPNEEISLTTLDNFMKEPLLVILGETSLEQKGPISSAATSDAVGMMEVMAAIKSHGEVRVGIDQWEDTADIVTDRNIIIIGSGMVNIYAFALNDIFEPAHFLKTDGRVLNQIVAISKKGKVHYGPHASLPQDSGIIIIARSPFNLDKTILWVAGITGIGTQAVANFLKDLISDAASSLHKLNIPNSTQPIACVVGAETKGTGFGWAISDYYRRWRILDYKVLWIVDRNGGKIL